MDRQIDTYTQGECHMKMKTENQGNVAEAEACQGWPANHQKLGVRHGTDSPTQLSEGTNPYLNSILNF